MTLDNEQQRSIILELIDKAQFPGHAIEMVAEFKSAVIAAPIHQPQEKEAP